jgi:hypothetical protein
MELIYLLTILVVIYEILLLHFNKITENNDRCIVLLALFGQICIYLFLKTNHKIFMKISHYLFWTVIIYITVFSNNKYLLLLTSILFGYTLFTRNYFNKCLFNSKYNEDSNNEGTNIFWDIIGGCLLLLSLVKIAKK